MSARTPQTPPLQPIVVINPNSTDAVTAAIDRAVEGLRLPGGPAFVCVTLREGPAAVETELDAASLVPALCRYVGDTRDASAFVIACYSDPGLHAVREVTDRPVYGIGESAMAAALTVGDRFGVISILPASTRRHLRHLRTLSLVDRCAGDLSIGLGVSELQDEARTMSRLCEVGAQLRDAHRADVLILACAGLAGFRGPLEHALGLPVIDPVQAAATFALGAALCRTPQRDMRAARGAESMSAQSTRALA